MPTSDLAHEILAALSSNSRTALSPEFIAIPGDAPRWLIPSDGKNLNLILRSWSPYRVSSRLKWRAIRLANRLGALHMLPRIQSVSWEEAYTIDWRSLGWNRHSRPVRLVYIGTPGPARKAVIHLVDPASGRCEAIAKVPLCAGARQAIVREADVLLTLAKENYSSAPRLLEVDRERGIATQEFVAGGPGSRRFVPEYWHLLRSLLLDGQHTSLYHHIVRAQEQWSWSDITSRDNRHTVETAIDELSDSSLLPACWVHGDFAPWNTRTVRRRLPMLIDWEDAKRGGLPLQDAFHFLHMQDFLFRAQPRSHSAEIAAFAKTLTIVPQQCRKLEIAYLLQAYRSCSFQGHQQRANFLLETLTRALPPCPSHVAPRPLGGCNLHLVKSDPANVSRVRAKLLAALIAELNQSRIPYCFLSGYEARPNAQSDVDIMFRQCDMHLIPGLLAQTAQSAGALLVQSIQHETSACYFVLAAEHGKYVVHLDVDCYTDYCREGRTWLSAGKIIANRTTYRNFYVPAVEDEFIYYLVKKVLKQSIDLQQLEKLKSLAARHPMACRNRMANFWPSETASRLFGAIREARLEWLQAQLPNLLAELQQSPDISGAAGSKRRRLLETARFLRRISLPTGFSIVLKGGSYSLRSQIADDLVRRLAPAFRHSRRRSSDLSLPHAAAQIFEVWAARIRSTLVVHAADDSSCDRPPRWIRRACFTLAGLMMKRDLTLVLYSGQRDDACKTNHSRRVVYLRTDTSAEQIVQTACRAVLERLAARTHQRLNLSPPILRRAPAYAAEPLELSSVGVD